VKGERAPQARTARSFCGPGAASDLQDRCRASRYSHAVRIRVAGVFGDGPAILAGQVGEQPEHEPADPAAGLDPREPGRQPIEQPVGLGAPPPDIYAVALRPGPPRRKITTYGWSTNLRLREPRSPSK
jgi:hypothetical protein